jgi:hypothetical protein
MAHGTAILFVHAKNLRRLCYGVVVEVARVPPLSVVVVPVTTAVPVMSDVLVEVSLPVPVVEVLVSPPVPVVAVLVSPPVPVVAVLVSPPVPVVEVLVSPPVPGLVLGVAAAPQPASARVSASATPARKLRRRIDLLLSYPLLRRRSAICFSKSHQLAIAVPCMSWKFTKYANFVQRCLTPLVY